jgi:hypothetical protein
VYIGPFILNRNYIEFTTKSFFGGESAHAVAWQDLDGKLNGDELVLSSKTDKKAKIAMMPAREINGMMLLDIFKEMCGYSLR